MVAKIKKILKLILIYSKMDLSWLLRDLKFASLAISCDFICTVASVASIFLLAFKFEGIGNMNEYEVLFMLAYFTIVNGLFQMLVSFNMGNFSRVIGRGQLEHMLIQPVSLPVQIMTTGIIPFTGGSSFVSGLIMLVFSIVNLEIILTWWWVLLLVASIIVSFAIYLGVMFLFSTFTFYSPVGAEEITSTVQGMVSIGMYPLSGMPLALQIPLITIVPTGLLGWFPSLFLLGKSSVDIAAWYPFIFAVVLWVITTYLFRKGLKHYVTKGINRYSNMGHRS